MVCFSPVARVWYIADVLSVSPPSEQNWAEFPIRVAASSKL